jgi:protein TonB
MVNSSDAGTGLRAFARRVWVVGGSGLLTLGCFIVLPLMQTIAKQPENDLLLQSVDAANIPPPPPPPEQEPEPPPPQQAPPPQLDEAAPPLDLSQLELALEPGFGGDGLAGDFTIKLTSVLTGANGTDADALFSLADLDQEPRVVFQQSPTMNDKMRRKAPATVHVLFVVDQQGRVEDPRVDPRVQVDPLFERPALQAVKQWKFEPGKRKGQPVRFRMRVPITFPAGS